MTKIKARAVLGVIGVMGYILVTCLFFSTLFLGDHIKLPGGDLGRQIIGMLGIIVGTWGTLIGLVFTFHFGTSQSSSEKNELIKKALPKE